MKRIKLVAMIFASLVIKRGCQRNNFLPYVDEPNAANLIHASFMKSMIYIATIFLFIVNASLAADTNVVYLPFDPKAYFGDEAKIMADAEQVKIAKTRPESRPANLDPEGHWGEIVDGFQMSIRFPTNVFTKGTNIEATVFLRNTTTNSLIVPVPQSVIIEIVMRNEHGDLLPAQTPKLSISGPPFLHLPSHRQIKYLFNLNTMFHLETPGVYYISAKRMIRPKLEENTNIEISSGEAKINIE